MENPAQSTPPTDATQSDHETMLSILTRLGLLGQKNQMDAAQRIKQFCKLLSSYNATEIIAEYDGSGDSGDLNYVHVFVAPTQAELDSASPAVGVTPGTPQPTSRTKNFETWAESIFNQPNALITRAKYEEFLDDMFSLLPGGWEINDGSYGVIRINVHDETITVDHNERYTDVRSETFSY